MEIDDPVRILSNIDLGLYQYARIANFSGPVVLVLSDYDGTMSSHHKSELRVVSRPEYDEWKRQAAAMSEGGEQWLHP
jgi:heme/copper-type cytochrome/quinol oxidase subunit 2